MEGTALQFIVYNTNLELVQFLKRALTELGFKPLGPYLDKRKGTITSKYKIERKKDYWKVVLARFGEVQSLLRRLPIRHREKVARKQIALSLTIGELWVNVEPRVKNLRASIAAERNGFVQEAEAKYAERHDGAKGLLIESTQGKHVSRKVAGVTKRLRLGDLDTLRGARSFTRHAEDAIHLPHWVRLVRPIHVPILASLLDDLVLPRPGLARIQLPLKNEHRANVHAHPV
jgi:hypothetical protein